MSAQITVQINEDFDPWLDRKVETVIDVSTDTVALAVKGLMVNTAPAGRLYHRPWGWHRASAPGQPPAPDTGLLVASIAWSSEGSGFRHFTLLGVSDDQAARYAVPLELGTYRIAPRPAWIPALLQSEGRLGSFE